MPHFVREIIDKKGGFKNDDLVIIELGINDINTYANHGNKKGDRMYETLKE